jgi:hypothetical protein
MTVKMEHISNIYWHFTGSPTNVDWHSITSPKQISKKPKPDRKAFNILKKIIKSKKLIAKATEKIFDGIETDKFCCVTDIPLKDLIIHSKIYGNIAIGFSAKRIQNSFFNPVLYLSRNALPSQQEDPTQNLKFAFPALIEVETFFMNCGFEKLPNGSWCIPALVNPVIPDQSLFPKYFINHLKITEFSDKAGESFYQEREWRKINDFYFDFKDIEAIIIPNHLLGEMYSFLTNEKLQIPIFTLDTINKTL